MGKKDIERLKCERDQLRNLSDELQLEVDQAENDVWEISMRETAKTQDICRLVRRIEEKVGYDQELLIRVDPSEPTDFLSSLDFEEQRRNQQARADRLAEEVRAEQAALNQLENEMEFLRDSLDQKRRISEDNRVEQTEKIEALRRIARDAEDKKYQISMEGDGPTAAEVRQMVDNARLELAATKDRFSQEIEQMKDMVRREEADDAQVQQCMKKELETFVDDVERTYKSTMAELETINAQSAAMLPMSQARGATCK